MNPILNRAEWSTEYIDSLPDSSFAYIEPGGTKKDGITHPLTLRHLPYKDADGKIDLPHLRNALARLPQSALSEDAKKEAADVLDQAEKEAKIGQYAEERAVAVNPTFMYVPFIRVATESREVEGVMSDEQIDTYGTVFDYDAMKAAVKRWSGNIREQHDIHKAVGRRVNVTFDDTNRSVLLRVRVSTGAEDTWKKILDGVLTGFSIGVSRYTAPKAQERNQKIVPVFTDFDLGEVSLVDAPSNPGAAQSGLTIYRTVATECDEFLESEIPETSEVSQTSEIPITLQSEMTRAKVLTEDEKMAKDSGVSHVEHTHEHAGYGMMHEHDHTHTHTDGTTHSHPHMHAHDHHDHPEKHTHPHVHVHDHDHTFRFVAADISTHQEMTPQERAITTQTGLEGHDPNTGGEIPVAFMITEDGTHPPMTGTHTHAHSAYGNEPDTTTPHAHEHTHTDDANHDHTHEENRMVTPTTERVGQKLSASTKTGLHAGILSIMRTCDCPTCHEALLLYDPDNDGGDDVDVAGDTDHDSAQMMKRMERIAIQSIRSAVQSHLQPIVAQYRAIATRFTTAPAQTQGDTAQLESIRASLEAVTALVRQIAQQDMPGGPVLRAADRTLPVNPQTIFDASANRPDAVTEQDYAALIQASQRGILTQQQQADAAAALIQRLRKP